jgi:hypothetical protein
VTVDDAGESYPIGTKLYVCPFVVLALAKSLASSEDER